MNSNTTTAPVLPVGSDVAAGCSPSGAIPIKLHEVAPYVTVVNLGAVAFGGFAADGPRFDRALSHGFGPIEARVAVPSCTTWTSAGRC